jgi:hypothetical protein
LAAASGNKTGFDPAYSFRYATADSAREETGDGRGRLRGFYSFTAPGGTPIRVEYRAGPDTGFIIDNEPGSSRCSRQSVTAMKRCNEALMLNCFNFFASIKHFIA